MFKNVKLGNSVFLNRKGGCVMELQYRKNDKTGENCITQHILPGLRNIYNSKKDYSKTYAIFSTRYSSIDSKVHHARWK